MEVRAIVLSGGRTNPTNRDVLLWINAKGDGVHWEEHSITYWHNVLETNRSLLFTPAVNHSTKRESTSYTSLVKTGPAAGFIIYARHLPPQPDVAFAMPFVVPSTSTCAGTSMHVELMPVVSPTHPRTRIHQLYVHTHTHVYVRMHTCACVYELLT